MIPKTAPCLRPYSSIKLTVMNHVKSAQRVIFLFAQGIKLMKYLQNFSFSLVIVSYYYDMSPLQPVQELTFYLFLNLNNMFRF